MESVILLEFFGWLGRMSLTNLGEAYLVVG